MWLRSLSLALAMGAVVAPGAHAAHLAGGVRGEAHRAAQSVRAGAKPTSPSTFIYGLCTFPTAGGLARTCSTYEGCNDAAAGERWQAGCWFR
jgi:hypothetical protein